MMDSRALIIGCMLAVMATSAPVGEGETHPNCHTERCFSRDCGEVLERDPTSVTGSYVIQPFDGGSQFMAYCDMREDGAWTVIQRRQDGLVNFYRGWEEYKEGFGNVQSEFWLGNEQISRLTSDGDFELLVEITDHANAMKHAKYSHFRVGTEWSDYTLRISGYTGTAGDSLSYHKDVPFSTHDRDNDANTSKNCALDTESAWWFKNCYYSSLNGVYYMAPGTVPSADTDKGVLWHHFKGRKYSHKVTVMMVKRVVKEL